MDTHFGTPIHLKLNKMKACVRKQFISNTKIPDNLKKNL